MYKLGQLPVYRGRGDAGLVLKQAEQALADGACVIVYPEGTATRDPDLWPMVGQDRRRPAGADHRRAGDPGRALGRAGHPALRVEEAPPVPAQDACGWPPGRRSTCPPTQGQRLGRAARCGPPPPTSWPTSPRCWPRSGRRRRPPYPRIPPRRGRCPLAERGGGAPAESRTAAGRPAAEPGRHEGSGHGGRVVGHHVRPGALRRRDPDRAVRPQAAAGQGARASCTRTRTTCPESR